MRFSPKLVLGITLFAWLTTPLAATSVRQFNLAEMTARAQRIYVATVRSATEGTVSIGGGQLAVVTYQLSVEEDLRGQTPLVKGERLTEFRMLGKQRVVRSGSLRSVSPLPEMPIMTVGQTYLVFATAPSAGGLSTTVGLGQGNFRVFGRADDRMAVNEVGNAGLFRDMVLPAASRLAPQATGAEPSGPLPYAALRTQILNLIGTR